MPTETGLPFMRMLLRRVAALAQGWRKAIGDPYRPEKHYMRGPGPKWHAKRGRSGGEHAPDARRGG